MTAGESAWDAPTTDDLTDELAPDAAEVVERFDVHQGNVFGMVMDHVQLTGSDTVIRREYLTHPGAVAMVPLREGPDGPEILLLNQYRHPVGARLWEIPAGLLDPGEDPATAAQRELAEEVNLRAESWHVVADIFSSPGSTSESLRVFLARDLTPIDDSDFVREEEEASMTYTWIRLADAVQAVLNGKLHNPSAVVGILGTNTLIHGQGTDGRPADSPWFRGNV